MKGILEFDTLLVLYTLDISVSTCSTVSSIMLAVITDRERLLSRASCRILFHFVHM